MERMARRRASVVFSAWLRFTKMSANDRLSLDVAQQRIAVADAQRAARTFELKHNAVQEDMEVLKREVARLNLLVTQRDRTITALTDELDKEKRKVAIATNTTIVLLQLLLAVLAFATQLLDGALRQLRFAACRVLCVADRLYLRQTGGVCAQGIAGAGRGQPGPRRFQSLFVGRAPGRIAATGAGALAEFPSTSHRPMPPARA